MRVFSILCALGMLCVFPVAAQEWQAEVSDDTVYRSAVVGYPGLGVGLRCHAPSAGGGQVIDSIWFESTIPPPDQFLIEFSQQLVPIGQDSRSDLIFFVDATGYALPPVIWNELSGSIETTLLSSDQLFSALAGASRLVLQVGAAQAWELPVKGLADAVAQARGYCMQVPQAPAASTGFALPPQVQSHVNVQCGGPGRIAPETVQAGDLDGDGVPDIVLDWGGVLCPGETRSGFCGAANCQVDLFLSSRAYAMSHSVLAVGADIVPHRSGRLGLRMGGTASVCSQIDCSVPWLWNGADLVQVP